MGVLPAAGLGGETTAPVARGGGGGARGVLVVVTVARTRLVPLPPLTRFVALLGCFRRLDGVSDTNVI